MAPVVQLLLAPATSERLRVQSLNFFKKGNQYWVWTERAKMEGSKEGLKGNRPKNVSFFVQKVQFFSRVGLGACDIARIATKLPVIIQPG